ncbi:MAG: asparagine--tRNA ligase [Candidatus Aenigmarchaeota archaeon]|nr:asparagine--tRNA ligase [Candidatus Aenigmarchaeota archaeon]
MIHMEFTNIEKIFLGKDGKVRIHGWLHNKRSSGGIVFVFLRDGTGIIQCAVKKDKVGEKNFDDVEKSPLESVIEVEGEVRKDPRSPGGFEVTASSAKVETKADEDYPIGKKEHGPDFLLDNRQFYLRTERMVKILTLRSKFMEIVRDWFKENGFKEFDTPMFTTAAVEGGSTLFPVKYFDQKAYLVQSWQLYAEAGIASLGKIFVIAPSFRAEKSRTRRHLTEYWHLEVEEPWCDFEGLLKTEEQLVTYLLHRLAKEEPEILKYFGRDPEFLLKINPPFERITHEKAVDILKKEGVKIKQGQDITYELEKILTQKFDKPFFLTHFPKEIKAFYHMPDPKNTDVTLSVDLLGPEGYGELTGGGQRIHDYKQLMKRIKEQKLNPKDYSWYLDLRRFGTVPHSGFGLGIERLITWILKLDHIRDAIPFPRLINRVYP